MNQIDKILVGALENPANLNYENLHALMSIPYEKTPLLLEAANNVRRKNFGNKATIFGLLEISNECNKNCAYCCLKESRKDLERFTMTSEEIIRFSRIAKQQGIKCITLQSGESNAYKDEKLAIVISSLIENGIDVVASFGEKPDASYVMYQKSGAFGYMMRFESSNPELYSAFHKGAIGGIDARLGHLRSIKKVGMEIITGSLIGLRGDNFAATIDDTVMDLLTLRELNADSITFGGYIPDNGKLIKKNFHLATIASCIGRLLLPSASVQVTHSVEDFERGSVVNALNSYADVVVMSITPYEYRKSFSVYPGECDNSSDFRELATRLSRHNISF